MMWVHKERSNGSDKQARHHQPNRAGQMQERRSKQKAKQLLLIQGRLPKPKWAAFWAWRFAVAAALE
jgi:hypothetical protein